MPIYPSTSLPPSEQLLVSSHGSALRSDRHGDDFRRSVSIPRHEEQNALWNGSADVLAGKFPLPSITLSTVARSPGKLWTSRLGPGPIKELLPS